MTKKMAYFEKPIQIEDSNGNVVAEMLGSGPATKPDYLKKRDLFVKQNNVYILDTFYNKSKMKITAFNKRVKDAIDYTIKFCDGCKKLIAPSDWKAQEVLPTINFYINCPDEKIDERADALLDTIADAVKHGIKIKVTVVGNPNGAWAKLLTKKTPHRPIIERQK